MVARLNLNAFSGFFPPSASPRPCLGDRPGLQSADAAPWSARFLSILKAREKVELALIPVAVAAVGLAGRWLPAQLGTGSLLVVACLAWLVQGGLRDLWLLYLLKSQPVAVPRRLACMCLESSLGLTGIVIGIVLALCNFGGQHTLTPGRWMLLAALVFTTGFLAKDLVISWRPLGVRRDPDHHSIVFTWWN